MQLVKYNISKYHLVHFEIETNKKVKMAFQLLTELIIQNYTDKLTQCYDNHQSNKAFEKLKIYTLLRTTAVCKTGSA